MTKLTNEERLAVVETKLDTVLSAIEKTNDKLDSLGKSLSTYATKQELSNAVAERTKQIQELELSIIETKKRHSLSVWITGTLSAVFGVILTLLVTYFITNIGK